MFGGDEGCRELQRIGSSQRMYPKKPYRRFSNDVAWLDLVPAGGQLFEPIECEQRGPRVECRAELEAR